MQTTVRTVCQSCHSECGVLAFVEDERVVRIQGDPDHPASKGYVCVKGKAEPQRVYHTGCDVPIDAQYDNVKAMVKAVG